MEKKPMFKFFKIPIVGWYLVRRSEIGKIEKTIQDFQNSLKILNKAAATMLGDIFDLKQELARKTGRTY